MPRRLSLRPISSLLTASLLAAAAMTAACGPLGASAPASQIDVGPETLAFRGTSTATLDIEANGSWIADAELPWLSVDVADGAGSAQVTVSVNRDSLSVGSYEGEVVLQGDENTTVRVPVTMRFPELSGALSDTGGHLAAQRLTPAAELVPGRDYAPGQVVVGLDRQMVALSQHGTMNAEITDVSLQAASESLAASVGATSAKLMSPDLAMTILEVDSGDVSAAIAAIERDGRARYAEPNFYYYPTATTNDEHYGLQWHYGNIGLEQAWDVTTGYEGLVVAVIDGDFHPDHPDLGPNLLPGWNIPYESPDLVVDNPGCSHHATHVAGTIAAVSDNGVGVAGVAPNVRILPLNLALRPEDEQGGQECGLLGTSTAIAYAAGAEIAGAGSLDEPVDVINMSLGGGGSNALQDAVEFAYAQGVTLIAAAGNSGGPNDVGFPAAYPEVIAVSSTDQFDELAFYSSYGPEVWVSAPGGDSVNQEIGDTGYPAGVLSTGWDFQANEPAYTFLQGTSMASPHTAGVAALILSANPNLTSDEVANIMAQTSVDLGPAGRDNEYGHGRIDAAAAVAAARDNLRVQASEMVVRLYRGDELIEEAPAGAGGAFAFGALAGGTYRLEAGNPRDGQLGAPGTVYGDLEFEVSYDGDPDIELPVAPL